MVDTLRIDRVDAFGGDRGLTPFLDSLADESWVFHNAYSSSSWTSPAVASLFTSRYPSQHGVLGFSSMLADDEVTLAELLTEQGYRAGGFSANRLVRNKFGFDQGFLYFRSMKHRDRGKGPVPERSFETGQRALRWIDGLREDSRLPVAIYLHVLDPHSPYAPETGALKRVLGDRTWPDTKRINEQMKSHITKPTDSTTRAAVRELYDAEVSSMDSGLEQFFTGLSKRNLLENALVVVMSDHGEELWDHKMFGHRHSLHEEIVHVPLLIHTPGQTQREDVFETVSVVDIAPTLLDWLGVARVDRFEGRTLIPLMALATDAALGRAGRDAWVPSGESMGVVGEMIQLKANRRTSHERMVVVGNKKLIRDFDGGEQFFDLSRSPPEREGEVSETEKKALRDALDRFVEHVLRDSAKEGSAESAPIDEESREDLRALGYIE
jgi:arylsulfatase A-like enzyme